ncbi:hypothetical protein B0H13DRAFT_1880886 [Mycena leptocephala]|nr:hypothetical protein B0H13DRAFT_1880886 [Mycena leptocephala]
MVQSLDQDPAHALKCLRNSAWREEGICFLGFRITTPMMEEHLRPNEFTNIIDTFRNNDKQDVLLAVALCKALRELLDAPPGSDPLFRRSRRVLKMFGAAGAVGMM